jgi:hypothetical protein
METIRIQSRVVGFVSAIVILLQISPALAGSGADGASNQRRPVDITFTKWITGFPLMAGFVGGDVAGDFTGEVLQFQPSGSGRIVRLEALYEVQAGRRSFTALIRGGQNNETGTAILEGVILGGWRTGAHVHVEYEVMTDCPGAPAGTCFEGTIRVHPPSGD